VIYFLDAPLEILEVTNDRPLSSTKEALQQRYDERYSVYLSTCDCVIPVGRDLEANLQILEKEIL
jgi:hypothetical protein